MPIHQKFVSFFMKVNEMPDWFSVSFDISSNSGAVNVERIYNRGKNWHKKQTNLGNLAIFVAFEITLHE